MSERSEAGDTLVSTVSVAFSASTFDLDTVKKAAYRVLNVAAADISPNGDQIKCTLTFHEPKASAEATRVVNDFKIEVLDQDLRRTIGAETAALRNAVLGHAFSKTGLQDE